MCTFCSDCVADMSSTVCDGDVKNICGIYTRRTCMHWWPGNLFSAHNAHRKNAHTPAQARPCNSAANPSPCKPLRTILQLELCQAQETARIHGNPAWRGRSCISIQESSDPLPWCGPYPICLRYALETWPQSLSIKKICFHLCSRRIPYTNLNSYNHFKTASMWRLRKFMVINWANRVSSKATQLFFME